jgi:hypothetical protein
VTSTGEASAEFPSKENSVPCKANRFTVFLITAVKMSPPM